MGKVSLARLITLTCLLAATAVVVHGRSGSRGQVVTKSPLQSVVAQIPGWQLRGAYEVSDLVVDALKLDDFIFQSYTRGQDQVTLYIGYYRTAAKVGAAHDPLVCFYGQGWQIRERDKGTHLLQREPKEEIRFATMIVEQESKRELILYWFQANGATAPDTFGQKMNMMRDRLHGAGEESAFVRFSTTIGPGNTEEAQARILAFVNDFYPIFRKHILGS